MPRTRLGSLAKPSDRWSGTTRLALALTLVAAGASAALARSTQNAAASDAPVAESLAKLQFLAGAWKADMAGDLVEEHWTEPAGDAIMGMFRWVGKDGKTRLFEILSIKADPEGPALRLRHFDGSLTPWKSEAESIPTLHLADQAAGRALFTNAASEGGLKSVEYRREGGELDITVSFKDPAREPLRFHLKRVATDHAASNR